MNGKKIKIILLIGLIIVTGKYCSRERYIHEILNVKPNEIQTIFSPVSGLYTNNTEAAEELIRFFGQYKVKKISVNKYYGIMNPPQANESFDIHIKYSKDKIILIRGNKNYVLIQSNKFYKITNGSVDFDWITEFWNKHGKSGSSQ